MMSSMSNDCFISFFYIFSPFIFLFCYSAQDLHHDVDQKW